MSLFSRSNDLLFGIDTIDEQHERIAALSYELDRAIRQKNEAEATRLFLEVADLLETHFDDEEKLMREHLSDPEAEQHRKDHIHFHNQIRQLLEYGRMKVEQGSGLFVVLPAISGQYFEEIALEDEKLITYLHQYNGSEPA